LADHLEAGGGRGLDLARQAGGDAVLESIEASGLRGRGGAGFPTGTKWRTVAANRSPEMPATVVVNAAEGEPGTFKDRALLRANPYAVLEGALIAASVVGADGVVVATKASFTDELARLRSAVDEVSDAGWADGIELYVAEGPDAYLFGEETGLLEVLDGRPPFPHIAPPFRHGLEAGADDAASGGVTMAGGTDAAPTLVNNVETLANVPGIVTDGPDWYRTVGTEQSPGTVVCTVTGSAERHGVGVFPMGTPLRDVLDAIGGPGTSSRAVAVLAGVANPLLPADRLDAPVSYEGLAAAGGGLGSAGFIVFDQDVDLAAVAHGVSRFLAVESCGQCSPCKGDGLTIAGVLDDVRRSAAAEADLVDLADRLRTVVIEARCSLAAQHQTVVESALRLFPAAFTAHVEGRVAAADPYLIAPLLGFDEDDHAILDVRQAGKQPDWSHDDTDSGQWPAGSADGRV
jgi:NADH:ubiquinone oxidoreductase subunit F (NADH-binding)